jgi:hypothetical protein
MRVLTALLRVRIKPFCDAIDTFINGTIQSYYSRGANLFSHGGFHGLRTRRWRLTFRFTGFVHGGLLLRSRNAREGFIELTLALIRFVEAGGFLELLNL